MKLHQAKARVQNEAVKSWKRFNCWGFLCMATGTGKSKIFVDQVKEISFIDPNCVFVLVVPTRKLRDKNWKEEFEKWDALELWETRVIRTCYASLNKLKDLNVGILCLDEGHRMTDKQKVFFDQNSIKRCMALTATMPGEKGITDMNKQMIFRELELKILFEYSLLQALREKVVADVDIYLLKVKLDDKDPYIYKPQISNGHVTEKKYYEDLCAKIMITELNSSRSTQYLRNERASFLKGLKSKTDAVKFLVPKVKGRFIYFFGGKEQASLVLGHKVFHSSSGDSAFNDFVAGIIDELGAINALNEGLTIPNVDGIFIVHMTTKLRDFIQRLGRTIRYRDNFRAKCYIVSCVGTVDYVWTKRVLQESKLKFTEVTLK